jgi:hypothetical protein
VDHRNSHPVATIYNQELMRYTLYTGEPAFTGFMRTEPTSTFWAWVYTVFYFLPDRDTRLGVCRGRGDLLPVRWPHHCCG